METDYAEKAWEKISKWAAGITEEKFRKWVSRKAQNLWKRDKKKLQSKERLEKQVDDNEKRAEYRTAIYKAIADMSENKCPYCGKPLRWDLIGTWDNDDAQEKGKEYKKGFAYLPTVDHKDAEPQADFVICSWIANDAKNDLPIGKFIDLCKNILTNHGYTVIKK